jgi:gliding motility-associated-like protein
MTIKKKYITALFFIILLFSGLVTQATHIRAGDLTAERISTNGLTYRFTLTIYRDMGGVVADPSITMEFGDGNSATVSITSQSILPGGTNTEVITYVTTHTYAGPNEYKVGVGIENRNNDILNMANSINTRFYIQSSFFISPFLGLNRSPILTLAPIDIAASRQRFVHNPGAVDLDGDSLSYELTICKKARDINVDGYKDLDDRSFGANNEANTGIATLRLNPRTGDLIWDAPLQPGQYNIAFFVYEWRNGILIGRVNRDMQIIVRDNQNRRPRITLPRDTCVVAGALVQGVVTATDPDLNQINLTASGALFRLTSPSNRATFDTVRTQPPLGNSRGTFRWQTTCNDVSNQIYTAIFRSEDFPRNLQNKLVDIQTWTIRVVGPPPVLQSATANGQNRSITLQWANYTCQNASTMTIWRRVGSFNFTPANCQTGIPAGYEKIAEVPIGTTTFTDTNLQRGVNYCYRTYAIFPLPKGGESLASNEVCATIPINAPFVTNVSVLQTSKTAGTMFVRWVKPLNINFTNFPRPHTYRLARAEGLSGSANYNLFATTFNENDTIFTDNNLNTEEKIYNYRVLFFSQGRLIDSSAVASSVRLSAVGTSNNVGLSWQFQVPWNNQSTQFARHYIYRERLATPNAFDLIDSVDVSNGGFRYTDTGRFQNTPLQRGRNYCYYVMTRGTYNNRGIAAPLLNNSQRVCTTLRDSIAPCAPTISLAPLDCNDAKVKNLCSNQTVSNRLFWRATLTGSCDRFISGYRVYYSPTVEDSLTLLTEIKSKSDTVTYFHTGLTSFAGRYAITVLDTANNESLRSNIVENDNCPKYELPNVITVNNDGKNDTFLPICYRFVEKVEFVVYNRWSEEIYRSSNDITINWAGVHQSGTPVSSGMYYYEAKITYKSLRKTDRNQTIKGWVKVFRD